ncbi:hypothetical protein EI94DRAFT_1798873 [Lactarius quietus]|nr:hypothetical protein EI94DRAFT_1798873 [Lactarius quietus]
MTDGAHPSLSPTQLELDHEAHHLHHNSPALRSPPANDSIIQSLTTSFSKVLCSLTRPHHLLHPTLDDFRNILRVRVLIRLVGVGVDVILPQHLTHLLLDTAIFAASFAALLRQIAPTAKDPKIAPSAPTCDRRTLTTTSPFRFTTPPPQIPTPSMVAAADPTGVSAISAPHIIICAPTAAQGGASSHAPAPTIFRNSQTPNSILRIFTPDR